MSALYVARSGDVAYTLPVPSASGVFFARSSDPGGDRLADAVLLRDGLVYLMRSSVTHPGRYDLGAATRGSATGAASSVAGNASGAPLAVFLSEMNARWRLWGASWVGDVGNAGATAYGGPVWVGAGSAIATIEEAATAWGWLPL